MTGILAGMQRRAETLKKCLALACLASLAPIALSVPPGYRYIGSRLVSEGRVVFWYWNVDYVEIGPYDVSFVARMHARAVDVNQERAYVAVIRCDSRTYREFGSQGPYVAIDDGEPIQAVWRAGCDAGKAVSLAARHARLNAAAPAAATAGSATESRSSAATTPTAVDSAGKSSLAASSAPSIAPAPPKVAAAVPAPSSASIDRSDERRVDRCVRFVEGKTSQFGEATMTNTCGFAIEVALCYKGGRGGVYDCPPRAKGMRMESLSPGATRNLPEYRREWHNGITMIACKGAMGMVMPVLNGDGGKTGCF
jgi:hypothetical protein